MTEKDEKTSSNEQEKELEDPVLEQEEQEEQKEQNISNELLYLDPKKLKPHPINTVLYGKEKIDEVLLDSIRTQGQLEPIVIDQDYLIISGHRRCKVLSKLKEEENLKKKEGKEYKEIKAICFKKEYNSELKEQEDIVEYNRQRKKTPLQIYNEIELLETIYAERSKTARYSNLKNVDVPDLEHREELGRTVIKEAKATGLSTGTLGSLKYIGKKYREKDGNAEYVMKEMEHDHLSIDAAYKMLKLMEAADPKNAKGPRASQKDKDLVEKAQEFVDKIKKGDVTPNKAEKDFDHFKDVYDSLPTKKTKTKVIPPEDGYNVFVADPKSIKEAQNTGITKDAKDAALFLWATTHNIKERLDLMQSWGFSLKAIGVWNTERKTGGYFEGLVEFLLLGIKGNLEPAEDYRPEVIFNVGHKEKNKSEPVYDMAEKMFPDQHYIDLYLQNGRKNWGQPEIVEVKEDSKVSSAF